jgi:archaellin
VEGEVVMESGVVMAEVFVAAVAVAIALVVAGEFGQRSTSTAAAGRMKMRDYGMLLTKLLRQTT